MVHDVNSCEDWQLQKVLRERDPGLLGYRSTEKAWTNVSDDVMGPFPTSDGQKKYLVMFVDSFTKYVKMKLISNRALILQAIEDLIIFRWGCPKLSLANNGTEFYNNAITEQVKTLGIRQVDTPAYHP